MRRRPAPQPQTGWWAECTECHQRFWVDDSADLRRVHGRCAGCRPLYAEREAQRQVERYGAAIRWYVDG
jgi:hypothetical protein